MATTHNAWLGQVGRDDRAGIGSGRHHKLSGNNTGTRVSGVWRFADIGAHGTPAYIVNRLRDLALQLPSDSRKCPMRFFRRHVLVFTGPR